MLRQPITSLLIFMLMLTASASGCGDKSDTSIMIDGDSDTISMDSDSDNFNLLDCDTACDQIATCLSPFKSANSTEDDIKDCIASCEADALGESFLECISEAGGCPAIQNCLAQVDGDVVTPDGDTDSYMADGDTESPETCGGACGETLTATCIGNNLCACLEGEWQLIICAALCNDAGQALEGCGYNQEISYDECLCSDKAPETCEGQCEVSGTGICLDDTSLCFCRENTWRPIDCPAYCNQTWEQPNGVCSTTAFGDACTCSN